MCTKTACIAGYCQYIDGRLHRGFRAGKCVTVVGGYLWLTNLQWQKVINTYKLRVLISLSKRAADNADLNIPQQFAAMVNNPAQYPIMLSNGDNLQYKYNGVVNFYPIKLSGNTPYSVYANISNTYLNITTPVQDPRTFIAATPAPPRLQAVNRRVILQLMLVQILV